MGFSPEIKIPGPGDDNLLIVRSLRISGAVVLFTMYSVMTFTVKLLYFFFVRGFLQLLICNLCCYVRRFRMLAC